MCMAIVIINLQGINGHLVYDTRDTETIKIYGAVKTTTCCELNLLH